MLSIDVPELCKAEGCKQGASILSKQGDTVRYMLTCRRHWYGQITNHHLKSS